MTSKLPVRPDEAQVDIFEIRRFLAHFEDRGAASDKRSHELRHVALRVAQRQHQRWPVGGGRLVEPASDREMHSGIAGYSQPDDNQLQNALLMPFRKQRDYWRRADGTAVERTSPASRHPSSYLAE